MYEFLYKEARKVRNWAEGHKNASSDLEGWCAICSFELFRNLQLYDLNPKFVYIEHGTVDGHCFVICNNYLIDITATQFNVNEKINVIKLNKVDSSIWFWNYKKSERKIRSIKELIKFFKTWDNEVKPFCLRNY